MFKTQKDETREFLEGEEKEKSLVSAIIFYCSWETQVAFRSFQTSTGFAPENPLCAGAAPF